MKHTKIWGSTFLIFQNPLFEVHRIFIKRGGYCSKHYHKYKYNMFYVEEGQLKITVYPVNNPFVETILLSGEQTTINPNEFHRFEAMEDTTAYEIYYSNMQADDIIREDDGGIKSE